jgi:N-alpha-acetyl-L-2,4-diaminobutyrate deacetylase
MIHTTIDFDKPGKQQGFLQVPYSHNLGGWANVMIPLTVIARG